MENATTPTKSINSRELPLEIEPRSCSNIPKIIMEPLSLTIHPQQGPAFY
jgi:hypothetical protein